MAISAIPNLAQFQGHILGNVKPVEFDHEINRGIEVPIHGGMVPDSA
jgi:hypothetical protein